MKIFYVGQKYDHYNPKRGLSFEHVNFYESLKCYPGAEVVYFPFERILEVGKRQFNEEVLEATKKERPDIVFFFVYSNELDRSVLEELKKYTKTIAWFADDSWRFYNYSKFWARYFTWIVTTYSWIPELYRKIGQPNVIRSQWAANPEVFRPQAQRLLPRIPDVSFVGLRSEPRERIISRLRRSGINVVVFGGGWPGGRRVSEEEMLEIFSLSKINLGLNPPPGLFNKNALGRLLFKVSINKIVPDFRLLSNIESWLHMNVSQIKARHFQIPACGGFLMTSPADDLGNFYKMGEEIVVYENLGDLVEKIRYYLAHDAEREQIAKAGYRRTIREHTYGNRFKEVFRQIGLKI